VQSHDDVSNLVRINTAPGACAWVRSPVITVIWMGALLLGGGGCATEKRLAVRPECPSLDAEDYYFPMGALDPSRAKIDAISRDWYSKYLRAMMEPSLSCGRSPDGFAYRFLWLRVSHHPIAVRVEKDGAVVTLSAVELNGTGGTAPGGIVNRLQRALSPAEQGQFLARLRPVGFWEMKKNVDRFGSMEGAQWVLEGAEDGRYRVIERWSPQSGAYREFCLLLIEFTGIKIPMLKDY
jgi:hypothetical protein